MAEPKTKLRVTILLGSLRAGSNSARVAGLVAAACTAAGAAVAVVDPRTLGLHLPGDPAFAAENAALAAGLRARVVASDAVLLVTPEYDGSYSAVLKILIEHLGYPSALHGKPVALLGVASGTIGALKALEHLRGVCLHVGALVMPEAKSYAAAHRLFDEDGVLVDDGAAVECARFAQAVLEFARWARSGGGSDSGEPD
jgi:NAD(P)H-dependent FMN reductase